MLIEPVYWDELFTTSSVLISLFWQILTGMAVTSASVLAAMFFSRAQISGVFSVIGFLLLGLGAQILDTQSPSSATVAVLSLLFPSMNFIFMLGYVCRYEGQGLKTNLLRASNSTSAEPSPSRIPGIALWMFLIIQIFAYPVLGLYVERWMHGSKYRNRTVSSGTETEKSESSPAGVEAVGLTKIYTPTFRQKWFTRGKSDNTVAVEDLNLVVRRGELLCLLGANGSGKTTTLEMLGGLRKPTQGSIRVDTASTCLGRLPFLLDIRLRLVPGAYAQIGICPQRNILWDELTVEEHVKIWIGIKSARADAASLDNLIESCDLSSKKSARAGTLSGGQRRKLQLACMFVGGSSVCLLDEVTSGLVSPQLLFGMIANHALTSGSFVTPHYLEHHSC